MKKLLKIKQVQKLTGLSRSTIYKKVSEGILPPPVQLSRRCSRWEETELEAAIKAMPRPLKSCHKRGPKSAHPRVGATEDHRDN